MFDLLKTVKKWLNIILDKLQKVTGYDKLKRELIISITERINDALYYQLEQNGNIDSELRKHIIYIANDALHKIKDFKLTNKETRELFKNIRRLYLVIQEYRKDKKGEDREKIIDILKEVKNII